MYKFKFADIGEGLHEGTVGEIHKKVGDMVNEGDTLFEVETDKMASEIPSPVTGKVVKVLIKQGETVHVGDDVFHFETEGGSVEEAAPAKEEKKETEEAPAEAASVVGEVKVSNELLSFDNMFAKKPAAVPAAKEEAKPAATATSTEFDLNNIKPVGNGKQVDVVVIGAGPGGYSVAEKLAAQNLKVVVAEKEYAGGVCLNVGCIPTKTLLKSSKVLGLIENAAEYGVNVDTKKLSLNWEKMQERKENVRTKLRKGVEALLKFSKVELVIGTAEIIDRYNVKVGKEVYTTKTIILATGSTPIMLPLPGFDKAVKAGVMIDSTGALDLKEIPKSLTVVGGGVIGLEFAMLYNELGTKVTILEGGPNILGPMDVDVRKYAEALASSEGIDVKTNVKVTGYDAKGLLFEEDGKTHSIKSDKILLSVGRKVNNLGLDKSLGIKVNQRGAFEVNENLQTSIDNIFAIGDVTGQVMLAHVAYKHAHVIEDLFKGRPNAFDRLKVPACVYTHPELSSIGYTEQELKELKIDYQKTVFQNQHIGRVLAEGKDDKGFTKLLIDKKYGKILGAHIINANSSDMIAEIALNMQLEGTIFELADTIHPHPSIAEGIYEAAVHAVRQFRSEK